MSNQKIDGVTPIVADILELRLPAVHQGAYVINGKLFFRLLDGSFVSYDRFGEPHPSMIDRENKRLSEMFVSRQHCGATMEYVMGPRPGVEVYTYSTVCKRLDLPAERDVPGTIYPQRCGHICFRNVPANNS